VASGGGWDVEGAARDEVVVVFAVDEELGFVDAGLVDVLGEVHEAADAVRLLAHEVVMVLKLFDVVAGEGHGLGAGEAGVLAVEQVGDPIALVGEVSAGQLGTDVGEVDGGAHDGAVWRRERSWRESSFTSPTEQTP